MNESGVTITADWNSMTRVIVIAITVARITEGLRGTPNNLAFKK